MKYKIEWLETIKEGEKNGRKWKMTKMSLKDEQGNEEHEVTTFDAVVLGQEIEGTIETVTNGAYTNKTFKKALEKPNFMKHVAEEKKQAIAEAQNNKAKQISEAQDRSAWMWAKNNASTLLASRVSNTADYRNSDDIADAVIDLATKIYNGEPTVPF